MSGIKLGRMTILVWQVIDNLTTRANYLLKVCPSYMVHFFFTKRDEIKP